MILNVLVLIAGHFGLAEVKLDEIGLCLFVSFDLRYSTSAFCEVMTGRKRFFVKRVSRGGAVESSWWWAVLAG